MKLHHEWIGWIMLDDRCGVGTVARQAGGGGPNVEGGRRDEELLRLGNLTGQCISGIALVLPSEGSRPDPRLSPCPSAAAARAKASATASA